MKVAVVGAGAWGTALAVVATARGHAVTLVARRPEQAASLLKARENLEYLPGVRLPDALQITSQPEQVFDADLVLLVVPSSHLLRVAAQLPRHQAVINCAKGLDDQLEPLCVGLERLGFAQVGVLSGPNLAFEVARGLPAAAVVASHETSLNALAQQALGGERLRLYASHDPIGVSLGGALKNVIALGAGMVDGLELGENARAALVTRGLGELLRFALACGAQESTIYGLAGLGDLLLTAAAKTSRNRMAGERIARGLPPMQGKAIEGIPTAARVVAWAAAQGLELPICQVVHRVVSGQLEARLGVQLLMGRDPKTE